MAVEIGHRREAFPAHRCFGALIAVLLASVGCPAEASRFLLAGRDRAPGSFQTTDELGPSFARENDDQNSVSAEVGAVSKVDAVTPARPPAFLIARLRRFRVPAIMLAGLIDGLNPCAFATVIFLITLLNVTGVRRRGILAVGLGYSLAVFVTYLLLGVLVTLIDVVCTGQLYLPTLTLLSRYAESRRRAFPLLLLYNLMFVVPLLAVMAATYFGASNERLIRWSKKNVVWGKIAMGLLFLGLAAVLWLF